MIRPWLIAVGSFLTFLVASYFFFTYGLGLILPFAIAFVLAELVDPLVTGLTKKGRLPRSVSVALVLTVLLGLVATGLTAAIARLVLEIQLVITQLPYLYTIGQDIAVRLSEQFGAFHATLPASVQQILATNLASLQKTLSTNLPSVARTLGAFSGLPALLTNLLIAVIATFFLSRDRRQIYDFLLTLVPVDWRPKFRQVKVEVWTSVIGFAKAQFFLISLTMVQSVIGLALIGSDYALLMGVVVGIADVMPLLGPATVYLPWIAYSFLFGSKVFGFKLLALWFFVAGVRQVLEPKLVGDQIGLHPLAILLSIYLGFQFFGALGFVVGPLMAILLKAVVRSGLLPAISDRPGP